MQLVSEILISKVIQLKWGLHNYTMCIDYITHYKSFAKMSTCKTRAPLRQLKAFTTSGLVWSHCLCSCLLVPAHVPVIICNLLTATPANNQLSFLSKHLLNISLALFSISSFVEWVTNRKTLWCWLPTKGCHCDEGYTNICQYLFIIFASVASLNNCAIFVTSHSQQELVLSHLEDSASHIPCSPSLIPPSSAMYRWDPDTWIPDARSDPWPSLSLPFILTASIPTFSCSSS